MSFAMDRYEPVAFHTQPELMRAAEAQTAVLHPAVAPTRPEPVEGPSTGSGRMPTGLPDLIEGPSTSAEQLPTAPPEPIAAYLVGMDATPLLRSSLADFLDAAGARRDVRVSVGVAAGRQVSWVLRDQVPFGVRAMPRYPEGGPAPDAEAALAAVAAAVVADAADHPDRRQLVVLLWDRAPEPRALPASLRSALVLHCVDTVLTLPAPNGVGGSAWVLARSRPGRRHSMLSHVGRLLDTWEAFAAALPSDLVLYQARGGDPP
jgi:hypothetical protein